MAWVFKRDYQVNAIDDITKNENNFVINPNPASNQLILESKMREDHEFNIINLLGEKVAFGRLDSQITSHDISALPQNVHIIEVANEAFKFIKTD
ncbi:MAG: hypothetical protein ACI9YE_002315 [Psychroserpens sp.]|jgi:hypothetical protein